MPGAFAGYAGPDAARYDAIIFDTAPTGLTLRVLALPSVSLAIVVVVRLPTVDTGQEY